MITAWTRHLSTQEEIDKFQQAIKSSVVLDRMNTMLEEMKYDNERQETSPDMYDSENWDYRQADRNGFIRCLNQILKLTNPDQRK